jgi:polyketide cyclase/dehydrase/lipid transport protein
MSGITVLIEHDVTAAPADTFAALADYSGVRQQVLPAEITDFTVLSGGTGAGTRFTYDLHATKKRIRHVDATVSEPEAGRQLLETDGNSTLTVRWEVSPAGTGSKVSATVSWQGAGGVGGFFERTFAPLGIKRIYTAELENLAAALRAGETRA